MSEAADQAGWHSGDPTATIEVTNIAVGILLLRLGIRECFFCGLPRLLLSGNPSPHSPKTYSNMVVFR